MTTDYSLPEPYADGTPQDHADALRDHSDLRIGGPTLDYLALAGAEVARLNTACDDLVTKLGHATDELLKLGFANVADRMDRWGANGYIGDWQDPQYDEVAAR